MQDITRIQQKLATLREADPEFRIAEAARHRYQLNACLDEDTLQSFELTYQVHLPQDYRQFLLQVGNGGAGPPYGIVPLQQAVISSAADFLKQPFPYTHFWNGTDPLDWFDRDLTPDEIDQVRWTVERSLYYSTSDHRQGTLQLVHKGCGYYDLLVISGPERGHMWLDARVSDEGMHPLPNFKSDERITFLQWYEAWLDRTLQQCGVALPPREEERPR